jgi:hypothetical protein
MSEFKIGCIRNPYNINIIIQVLRLKLTMMIKDQIKEK